VKNTKLEDHRDNRGYVVNPFEHMTNTGDITNCHAFTIEPGHSRGDHTHPGRNEQVLVLSGEITVSTPSESIVLTGTAPSILSIPQGQKHTFSNTGKATAVVICWSSARDSEYSGDDTLRDTAVS